MILKSSRTLTKHSFEALPEGERGPLHMLGGTEQQQQAADNQAT